MLGSPLFGVRRLYAAFLFGAARNAEWELGITSSATLRSWLRRSLMFIALRDI